MRTYIIGILSASFMMGCYPTPHDSYEVFISSDISTEHQQMWLDTTAHWQDKVTTVGKTLTLEVFISSDHCSGDHCIMISEVDDTSKMGSCTPAPGGVVAGCTSSSNLEYNNALQVRVLKDMKTLEYQRLTAYRHEFGHALGLKHVDANNLMHYAWIPWENIGAPDIACGDLQQYREVRHLLPGFCP